MSETETVPSFREQTKQFWKGVPAGCRFLLFMNIITYVLQQFDVWFSWEYAFNVEKIIVEHEWYRLWTFNFLHVNIIHILFNMFWVVLGCSHIEQKFGTFSFLALSLQLILFVGPAYLLLLRMFTQIIQSFYSNELFGYSMGFSGVIFAYIQIVYAGFGADVPHSFFGFHIKGKYIPWLMLILSQLMFANVACFGHLAGILVGQMVNWSLLNWSLPPCKVYVKLDKLSHKVSSRIECFLKTDESEVRDSGFFGAKCYERPPRNDTYRSFNLPA